MPTAILILSLIVPDGPVPAGQPIPITLELRNVSDHPVWVVGVLDGSENGIRYPHYRPSIRRDGAVVAAPPAVEDPMVSPLTPEDFRLLQPGESYDPIRPPGVAGYVPLFTFLSYAPDAPGEYTLSVTFSTESASPEQWLGRFGQDADRDEVLRRIAEIPRLTLTATATVAVR